MATPRRTPHRLTRRELYLTVGLVLGAILIVVVLPAMLLLYFVFTCSEDIEAFPSPDGEYVALRVAEGCGGAAGSVTSKVRVRRATEPNSAAETVLNAGIGLHTTLTWPDNRNLVIDYPILPDRAQYVGPVKQPTSGITVVARPRAP